MASAATVASREKVDPLQELRQKELQHMFNFLYNFTQDHFQESTISMSLSSLNVKGKTR